MQNGLTTILSFFLLMLVGTQSPYTLTILPTSNYLDVDNSFLSEASAEACEADCGNCQIQTNECEECYVPYFSDVSGNC